MHHPTNENTAKKAMLVIRGFDVNRIVETSFRLISTLLTPSRTDDTVYRKIRTQPYAWKNEKQFHLSVETTTSRTNTPTGIKLRNRKHSYQFYTVGPPVY